jgi:hypothetical protein
VSRTYTQSRWTPQRVALLRRYHAEGKSGQEIARLFGGVFSRQAVDNKRSRLGLVSQRRSLAVLSWRKAGPEEKARPMAIEEAHIWHLIDLKRAGHSPTRTELHVESEGVPMRFSQPLAGGLASSPAALCMEG